MIKLNNVSVMNFENAIRGMRNPMNSWDKSDSNWCYYINDLNCDTCPLINNCSKNYFENDGRYIIREEDMELAKKLIKAGSDERKFLRQIFISAKDLDVGEIHIHLRNEHVIYREKAI